MPLNPRQRFLQRADYRRTHFDYTGSDAWSAASDAAMLQLISDMDPTTDPVIAAAGYQRLMGARQYRDLLSTIGEQPKPAPRREDTSNLDHSA